MTIMVETGEGLTDAVSYIAAVDAADYFAARGVDTWAEQDEAAQEAALVRATASLDSWLRGRWLGKKLTQAQSLAWPRSGVVDEDGYAIAEDVVPVQVTQATCEVALIELTESFIQQSVSNSNTVASESVGPIAVSYRADAPTVKYYPQVEALLRGLAAVGGAQIGFSISLTEDEIAAQNGGTTVFDYPEYFNIVKGY